MHASSYFTGKRFFEVYTKEAKNFSVVEIGSQNVNGALRDHRPENCSSYVGLDMERGLGVDLVLEDPYVFPFQDNTFDFLITSSCFEHSEMFWITFIEGMRILKPHGVMYCNAPALWEYHNVPIDCWRFFPHSAKGLETWAHKNGYNSAVLESFVVPADKIFTSGSKHDWASVFIKDKNYIQKYPDRMIDSLVGYTDYTFGYRYPHNERFSAGWNQLDSPWRLE